MMRMNFITFSVLASLIVICFAMHDDISSTTQSSGLKIINGNFSLNNEPFRIKSGSLHYFRIPHQEWSDRLVKLKAMGLNTVDIYIPWNLHEPHPGTYIFKDEHIELMRFLDMVSSHELFAIVRPGPYICSEWDLGGLPSWLLRDENMKLRTMYPGFIRPVEDYFGQLFPLLRPYQYSLGGPVIAFQIENEYGTYGNDTKYMAHLQKLFKKHDLNELLFVCDNEEGLGRYKLDGVLQTINFMSKNANKMIKKLLKLQPNQPVFVTEFWDGWFDHWGEKHHVVDVHEIIEVLQYIIHVGGSFNFYMWHGGTNFGFMNGANANDDGSNYQATVTSYDYDAPLSESGDAGVKYKKLQEFLGESFFDSNVSDITPFTSESRTYGKIQLKSYLSLNDLATRVSVINEEYPVPMENLNINKNYGQSYGYALYKTKIRENGKVLKITKARDIVIVILNDAIIYKGFLHEDPVNVHLQEKLRKGENNTLQILVENCGRVNYGMSIDNERKGILGSVLIDDAKVRKWEIFHFEFESDWLSNVSRDGSEWKNSDIETQYTELPGLYKGNFHINGSPRKTFISLPGWYKGAVFVNGFNLGRYWNIGPQKTLYVPAQYLKSEENEILVFDLQGRPKQHKWKQYPVIVSNDKADLGEDESNYFLI